MIDAYEIGIQLLLQEDVSAGLVVINQGLADVDRAIAATSANLAGLVQEANKATRAVAAVAGQGRAPTVQPSPAAVVAPEGGAAPGSERLADRVPVEAPTGQQPRREPNAGAPSVPTTSPPAAPTIVGDRTDPVGSVEASAPRAPVRPEPVAVDAGERSAPAMPEVVAPTSVSPVVPETPSSVRQEPVPATSVSSVALVSRPVTREPSTPSAPRLPPAISAPVAITAAISPARVPAEAPDRNAPRRPAPSLEAGRREQPVAPGAGAVPQGGAGGAMRVSERAAAASPSPERETGQSGGGSVMLDGRMVGRWLTDHMASEASRPPSGTTFFDSRQTPAWNVSGAV